MWWLRSFRVLDKNRSQFTENLFFFRVVVDIFIIFTYFLIYVFYFYHEGNDLKSDETKSALQDWYGIGKILWGYTARHMWGSIVILEVLLYFISVRPAKKRAIYQEYNRKEHYWKKGEDEPRKNFIKQQNKLEELKYLANQEDDKLKMGYEKENYF